MAALTPSHAAILSGIDDLHRAAAARRLAPEIERSRGRRLGVARDRRAAIPAWARTLTVVPARTAPHH